jgi:hypothetical protein
MSIKSASSGPSSTAVTSSQGSVAGAAGTAACDASGVVSGKSPGFV